MVIDVEAGAGFGLCVKLSPPVATLHAISANFAEDARSTAAVYLGGAQG